MIKKLLQKLFQALDKIYSPKLLICPISSASRELKRQWDEEVYEIFDGVFNPKNEEHQIKAKILNAKYVNKMHKEWGLNSLQGFFSEEKCN